MNNMPAVIVKKGGFLSGLFGFLTACVLCATGLGFYSMHLADKKLGDLSTLGGSFLENLPRWKEALPPALADVIQDRRAPDYRSQVDVSVRIVESARRDGYPRAVVELTNRGQETVSLMALNVVIEDENGVPLSSFVSYAATPLALDDNEWRGLLLPGSTRKFVRPVYEQNGKLTASAEVTELRVLRAPQADEVAAAGSDSDD